MRYPPIVVPLASIVSCWPAAAKAVHAADAASCGATRASRRCARGSMFRSDCIRAP